MWMGRGGPGQTAKGKSVLHSLVVSRREVWWMGSVGLGHCGSRAAAQLWPVASPWGGGRCRQRAPGGGGRTPAPAVRPWSWRWLLLLFLPSPLLLCDRWGRAVCRVQRLTKRGDQIGNQSSPGAGWPGACLPATSRSGRSRGMKQLLPFSPRSCLGFYFYFSQDRVAGEGSQGR